MMKLLLAGICLLTVGVMGQAPTKSCDIYNCHECLDEEPQCYMCPAGTAETDDEQACVPCPENCETCEALTATNAICTKCANSYFIDSSNGCTQCDPSCITCASESQCADCASGFFEDDTGACTSCPTRCADCSSTTSCTACVSNAYKDDNGVCQACPANAATCRYGTVGSSTTKVAIVTGCNSGYEIKDDTLSCLRCPTECASCSNEVNSGNDAKCLSCNDNYFEDGDVCTACTTHCKDCVDDSTCVTCKDEYALKEANIETCQACISANCKSCTVSETGETCTACKDGYTFDGTPATCTACAPNCDTCDTNGPGQCDTNGCRTGFFAVSDGATPPTTLCYALPANCNSMAYDGGSTTGICDGCETGWTIDASTPPVCLQCANKCDQCDGSGAPGDAAGQCDADQCQTGYDDQANSATPALVLCLAIPTGCTELDATANSDTPVCNYGATPPCAEGYLVNANTPPDACDKCTVSNCADCTGDLAACVTCKTGYYRQDATTCVKCSANCAACSDGTTCTTCAAGYGQSSGSTPCVECGDLCDDCLTDSSSCTTCSTGSVDNGDGVCISCPDNCDPTAGCTWDSTNLRTDCVTCVATYSANQLPDNENGGCEPCPNLCNACDVRTKADGSDVMSCITCQDGYGTNGYICADCPQNCLTCTEQDNKGMMCSKCEEGYVVQNGLCKKCPDFCLECDTNDNCKDNRCQTGYGLSYDKKTCVDCPTLTIANCATCTDHPAYQNDTASCLTCASDYYLKDMIGNVTRFSGKQYDPECVAVDTSVLQCDTASVIDPRPMCQKDKCYPGYDYMYGLCVKPCFRCGDSRTKDTVAPADCNVDNSTAGAMIDYCEDGMCLSYSDGTNIFTGCTPSDMTCDDTCSTTGGGSEECLMCCSYRLCNDDANVLANYNSASCLSSTVALVISLLLMLLK